SALACFALQVLAQQHELGPTQRLGSVGVEADGALQNLLNDLRRLTPQLDIAPLQRLHQRRQRRVTALDQLLGRGSGIRSLEGLDQVADLLLLDDLADDRLGRPGRWGWRGWTAEQAVVEAGAQI